MLPFELRYDLVVRLQIDDVIDNKSKHRPIGPNTGTPEHATDTNRPKLSK